MRPHGRASVSPSNPRAWAVCDRCGFLYNKFQLQWQFEWYGPRTQNTNLLVCDTCVDNLQEQLRTIVLPADPTPIANPRIERYTLDNNPISSLGTDIGTMDQGGGLSAAFDSNINKPFSFCCQLGISNNGYFNNVGISWGENNQQVISSIIMNAPNDAMFFSGGPVAYKFQGTNTNASFGWTDLYSGTTAGTIGEEISVDVSAPTSYLYHRINFNGNGINSIAIAQLRMYASG